MTDPALPRQIASPQSNSPLAGFLLLYAATYAAFGMASPLWPRFFEARSLSPEEIGTLLAGGMLARLIKSLSFSLEAACRKASAARCFIEQTAEQLFVRPDEVIMPPGMPQARNVTYVLDAAAIRHGLHVTGTAAEWATEVAMPLRGNSNVALSFSTFFAAPLLRWASEPGGGNHQYGWSTIGKTMISDVGQSIYGWPHETSDDTFGVSWGGTAAGFDALALARTDLGAAARRDYARHLLQLGAPGGSFA